MNKRIRELAVASGYVCPEMAGRLQSFAAALLFECIKVAQNNGDTKTVEHLKELLKV